MSVAWIVIDKIPDSKFHGAHMGPIWGRQDPDGPHVGPMNFAIWDVLCQTNTWTSVALLSIGPLVTDFNDKFPINFFS